MHGQQNIKKGVELSNVTLNEQISVVLQSIYAKRQDRHETADKRICTVSRCDDGENNWSYRMKTHTHTRPYMLVTYTELYRQLDVRDILCI